MADMETALRARLKADATFVAAGSNRVEWEEQPQSTSTAPWPLPHTTLNIISDIRPEHLKGYDRARPTRVQADCRATTPKIAKTMAKALIAAVSEPGIFSDHVFGRTKAEGPRPLNERVDNTTVFRQSVDLIIWHVGD
jgi:hypothetical protein